MSRKRTVQIRNLTAKVASLFLAVIVWFLITDLQKNQGRDGETPDDSALLGPAFNPDLQGPSEPVEPRKETPTVH